VDSGYLDASRSLCYRVLTLRACALVVPYSNDSFVWVRVLNFAAPTYLSLPGVRARATHKAHTKTPKSTPIKKHAACVKKLNI